ncbi:hypothetical protein M8J75_008157 [Diaphorina citri]|nr:hypothetical protein M8J75_008157 [Diaphorina citri]
MGGEKNIKPPSPSQSISDPVVSSISTEAHCSRLEAATQRQITPSPSYLRTCDVTPGPSCLGACDVTPGPSCLGACDVTPGPSCLGACDVTPGPSCLGTCDLSPGPSCLRKCDVTPGPSCSRTCDVTLGPSCLGACEVTSGPSCSRTCDDTPGPSCSRKCDDTPGPSCWRTRDLNPGPSCLKICDVSRGPSSLRTCNVTPGPSCLRACEGVSLYTTEAQSSKLETITQSPSCLRTCDVTPSPSCSRTCDVTPGPSCSRTCDVTPGPSCSRTCDVTPGPSCSRTCDVTPGPSCSRTCDVTPGPSCSRTCDVTPGPSCLRACEGVSLYSTASLSSSVRSFETTRSEPVWYRSLSNETLGSDLTSFQVNPKIYPIETSGDETHGTCSTPFQVNPTVHPVEISDPCITLFKGTNSRPNPNTVLKAATSNSNSTSPIRSLPTANLIHIHNQCSGSVQVSHSRPIEVESQCSRCWKLPQPSQSIDRQRLVDSERKLQRSIDGLGSIESEPPDGVQIITIPDLPEGMELKIYPDSCPCCKTREPIDPHVTYDGTHISLYYGALKFKLNAETCCCERKS